MWILFFLSVVLGAVGSEHSPSRSAQQLEHLHCPPCEQIHCSSQRTLKLQCKGGVTTGVCGCCPVCARTEGETCGGIWDYLGKCDEGLVCVYQEVADDKPDAERKGTCKAGEIIIYILIIKQVWLRLLYIISGAHVFSIWIKDAGMSKFSITVNNIALKSY